MLAGLVAWAPPAYAQEDEPGPLPPPSARVGVLGTGALITLGSYGLAYGTSYLWPHSPAADSLRVPVVGPWMAIPQSGCGDSERGCDTFPVIIRSTFATVSALGQLGGLALLIEGILMETSSDEVSTAPKQPALYAAPVSLPAGAGVLVGGTF